MEDQRLEGLNRVVRYFEFGPAAPALLGMIDRHDRSVGCEPRCLDCRHVRAAPKLSRNVECYHRRAAWISRPRDLSSAMVCSASLPQAATIAGRDGGRPSQ
jgi:hypothetical protein